MTEEEGNVIPINELHLTYSMIQPAIANEVNIDFDKLLTVKNVVINDEGDEEEKENKLMANFDYYKRDLRLANLTTGEYNRAQEWLNHTGAVLRFKVKGVPMRNAFDNGLMHVATTTELSQSKTGFLRKQLNTSRVESVNSSIEPKKRNMLGSNKNNKGGYE